MSIYLPGGIICNTLTYRPYGSMAGTPLADLAFTVAISRVFGTLRKRLSDAGLESSIEINGRAHVLEHVSFVDDGAIPVTAKAEAVVEKNCAIASEALNVFSRFKMI